MLNSRTSKKFDFKILQMKRMKKLEFLAVKTSRKIFGYLAQPKFISTVKSLTFKILQIPYIWLPADLLDLKVKVFATDMNLGCAKYPYI